MFGFGKKYPYIVTVKISGRHPYLKTGELDKFKGFKYEYVHVMAKSHDDAIRRCFGTYWKPQSLVKTDGWVKAPISVRHAFAGQDLKPGRGALAVD